MNCEEKARTNWLEDTIYGIWCRFYRFGQPKFVKRISDKKFMLGACLYENHMSDTMIYNSASQLIAKGARLICLNCGQTKTVALRDSGDNLSK